MDKIETDKATLRKFDLTIALCFALITLIIFSKNKHFTAPAFTISLFFLLAAVFAPGLSKYFYIGWMKLAFILGWINVRLLLCVIFYFIVLPTGLIMRLFKVKLLERKFDPDIPSYWKPKEDKGFSPIDYERQF